MASARTDQYSGPGNAGLYTTVYLRRTSGEKNPIEILLFDQQVAHTQHPNLDFQAVKCAGIDISVRELSN
jgi:hypothetical protein